MHLLAQNAFVLEAKPVVVTMMHWSALVEIDYYLRGFAGIAALIRADT
jgi:hypothetical protein